MTTANSNSANASALALIKRWASRVFGMDIRSLAVFRVFLGVVVLLDVMLRVPDAEALYSDAGCFPRFLNYQFFDQFTRIDWRHSIWSWNWLSGDLTWQYVLFGIEALAAFALIAGWWSRIATIVVWMLVVSQHVRNPLAITSGDTLLKLMLFWSMFLPLGKVWSLDAIRAKRKLSNVERWHVSGASAGLLMQIVLMYFFTGVAKFNSVWFDGQAMEYVLHLDLYVLPFGRALLKYPLVLKAIAWGTLAIELVGIWLLLSSRWNSAFRLANLVAYWAFHLGIALSMTIGLFPLICMIAWLPLLPREVWTSEPVMVGSGPRETRYVGPLSAFCRVANVFCALLIGLIIWWNLSNLTRSSLTGSLPPPVESVGRVLGLEQHFQMFGIPPNESPWFVYETRLRNGDKVDIFRPGHQLSLERPENISATFPSHNWRKLHQNLVDQRLVDYRSSLLDYAVRKWNAAHSDEEQVKSAKLTCYIETTGPNFNPINRFTNTWGVYQDAQRGSGSLFDELEDRVLGNGTSPF